MAAAAAPVRALALALAQSAAAQHLDLVATCRFARAQKREGEGRSLVMHQLSFFSNTDTVVGLATKPTKRERVRGGLQPCNEQGEEEESFGGSKDRDQASKQASVHEQTPTLGPGKRKEKKSLAPCKRLHDEPISTHHRAPNRLWKRPMVNAKADSPNEAEMQSQEAARTRCLQTTRVQLQFTRRF